MVYKRRARYMKKTIPLISAAIFAALVISGCFGGNRERLITVISREDGSGTRSAFVELFGLADENTSDNTAESAEITNNTAVMMSSVAGDKNAVGYISLGSLNNTVKALRINGAEATVDNIRNGSYAIFRPFLIVVRGEPGMQLATKFSAQFATQFPAQLATKFPAQLATKFPAQARDFITFILSAEGQEVVKRFGCISRENAAPFTGGRAVGKVIVAGSSSVNPVMEKLREAYIAINPGVDIEIQQSDSSTGINAVLSGVCDIGMVSRALKAGEKDQGLTERIIALDGIAVIVHRENPREELSKEGVRKIFSGEITHWKELE
jgi:phosphate transport system substrate-binding protein